MYHMKKLTAKQQRFCDEYLKDLNGSAAAIRAGYSIASAKEIASENLTKPNIVQYIQERQKDIQEKAQITVQEVVEMILDDAKNGEHENNRLKAKDMLMKHLGGYAAEKEVEINITPVNYYAPKKNKDK